MEQNFEEPISGMTEDSYVNFLQLYEELYKVLPTGNLQKLMETCYQVIGIPILCVDITYKLLGASPNELTGEILWDYLLEHKGNYRAEQIQKLYEEGIIQSVDTHKAPYVIDWGYWKNYPNIQGIVRVNGIVEGYVTMNCTHHAITPDRIRAMEIIQNICAFFFQRNNSESNLEKNYEKLFAIELFNNKLRTEKELNSWISNMAFQPKPPYRVVMITTEESPEKQILSYLRKSIQSWNLHQILLIQDNYLYILFYACDTDTRIHKKILQTCINHVNAICGISNLFRNLLDLEDYKQQAKLALTVGQELDPSCHIYDYHKHALPALLIPRYHQLTLHTFIPRVLLAIAQYDNLNSTEFLPTLHSYVLNLRNTNTTAGDLHIHRNTLLYRLNKIEEVFDLKLKDFETFLHLMIAFYTTDIKKINLNTTTDKEPVGV